MKSVLVSLLWGIMRSYIGGGVFDRIAALVSMLQLEDVPGAEKRQRVLDAFAQEAKDFGSIAIAAAIEIVLLKLKQ